MPIGPVPNPPWQKTVVDNGAEYFLNEQPPERPAETERVLFIKLANGSKIAINLGDGTTVSW